MKEIKEKKCFKCEKTLPIEDFYLHKKMLDGHLNKCISCTKKDVRKRETELKNDKDWLEKERKRCRDRYYRLGYINKKPTKEKRREIIKRNIQKYPEKYMAAKYTEIFLTKVPGMNLHHWSYNQEDWLDIIELTIKDHHFLHRFLDYDQNFMMFRDKNGNLLKNKDEHIKLLEKLKLENENYRHYI